MTVETDLEKQVDEVTEKMDNKLSTNGENVEKHVRNLRGPIVLGRAQHGVVKWFSVAKGLFLIKMINCL